MKSIQKPLESLSVPAPQVPDSIIKKVLLAEYGVTGRWRPLLSERDQNLWVESDSGDAFVFKIANADEDPATTNIQAQVLDYLAGSRCDVQTPRLIRSKAGERLVSVEHDNVEHRCRLVSFVPGKPQSGIEPNEQTAQGLGAGMASLLAALAGFEFSIKRQPLLWDVQQAAGLRDLLPFIKDAPLREASATAIDDFELRVAPALENLPAQTIHSDLNPGNVLVDERMQIAGFIDFGDMVKAPRVLEVAITAAYQRGSDDNPLPFILAMLRGFRSRASLDADETDLIFDIVRVRLVTSIAILRWRLAERGSEDSYAVQNLASERSADAFLLSLDQLGREAANRAFRSALEI